MSTIPKSCIVAVDVDYRDDGARAALVAFHDWSDGAAAGERVELVTEVAPYEPGRFYKRELPCILRVIEGLEPRLIVVDGYVWLGEEKKGLGAHLHDAIAARADVIGVSKTYFAGATNAVEIYRSGSARPLFVTAAGIDAGLAAIYVRSMHGDHRIPTLLKRVDQLCRNA